MHKLYNMNKEQIQKRIEELKVEFEKIKNVVLQGENRLVQLQGAHSELDNMLKEFDKPDKGPEEKPQEKLE